MQHEAPSTLLASSRVTVREAVDADAEQIQRFVANLVGERLPVIFRRDCPPTLGEERGFIQQVARSPRSILLVAEAGEEIVGMLDFHGHQKPQRSHAGEFGMSIAKPWRRRGVGFQLLAHLFHWASAERLRRIELSVFSNNTAAVSLYERLGFVREGTQREAVEVEGHYVDIVLMAKALPDPATALRRASSPSPP